MCTCTKTDRGTDTLGCDEHELPLPPHDEEAGRQWELDHPNGISAEEEESMARYAYESCREEHGDDGGPMNPPDTIEPAAEARPSGAEGSAPS